MKSFFTLIATLLVLIVIAMLVAGGYGALHDQISYTVGPEYFTQFKYQQFGLVDSPLPDRVKVAMIGFLASWWMGVPIGLIVGSFGLVHRTIRRMFVRTLQAYGVVLGVTFLSSMAGLSYGWFFASHRVADYMNWYIPDHLHRPDLFLTVGHMHNASYLGGMIGLLAGIAWQCCTGLQRKPLTEKR
jgi:hypothetical protein